MKKRFRVTLNAPFTIIFSALALIALIISHFTNGASNRLVFGVYRSSFADPLTYLRFFTHVLGHESFEHYAGNIMLMLVLGPGLEERYGSVTMLKLTLSIALITGVLHFLLYPNVVLVGASGIVFMMILLSSIGNRGEQGVPLTLLLVIALYLGKEVYNGMFVNDNVSQLSHIVGGACGAAFGMLYRRGRRGSF